MSRYYYELAVEGPKGSIRELNPSQVREKKQFRWKFNIRFSAYSFREFWVLPGSYPRTYYDEPTQTVYHGNTPPDPVNVVSEEYPNAQLYLQRFNATRTITDVTMFKLFHGWNIFMPRAEETDDAFYEERGYLAPEETIRERLLKSFPVYTRNDPENFDWATLIVYEYLRTLYKPHYLGKILKKKVISVDESKTWNSFPLFNGGRTFGHELYDGLNFCNSRPAGMETVLGTCVPQIVHEVFLQDDDSKNHNTHKRAARDFIDKHRNEGVTLEQFGQFIESLKDVSLMVFGPLDNLIYVHTCEGRAQKLILCRLDDNHLILLRDPHLIKSLGHCKHGSLRCYRALLSHLPGARKFNAQLDWEHAEVVTSPQDVMFTGEGKIYVYEEGSVQCEDSGGMEMIRLMRHAMETTKTKIMNIAWDKKGPDKFEVPGNKNMIVRAQHYSDRRDLLAILEDRFEQGAFATGLENTGAYHWKNQSFTKLATIIYQSLGYPLDGLKSTLRKEHYDVFAKTFAVGPMQDCLIKDDERPTLQPFVTTYDCVRNYTSILYNQKSHWNVFNEFTEIINVRLTDIKEVGPGEYFVNRDFCLGHPGMKVRQGMYPSDFILKCLHRNFLQLQDLTKYMRADYHLPADHFREFIEYVYALPDPNGIRHKQLVNFFLGDVGKMYNTTDYSFVTDNHDVCDAVVNEFGDEVAIHWLNEQDEDNTIFLAHVSLREPQYRTGLPIMRQVYCMSWMCLSDMWQKVWSFDARLLSFKCDAISVLHHKLPTDLVVGPKTLETLGKMHEEEGHIHYHQRERPIISPEECQERYNTVMQCIGDQRPTWKHQYKRNDLSEKEIANLPGLLISGAGGTGKTHLICSMMREFPNHIAFCYQNVACVNLREATGSTNVYTFDSFFQNTELEVLTPEDKRERLQQLAETELVFVDEFGQVPPDKYQMLYRAWLESKGTMRIVMAGDINQTTYLASRDEFRYNYKECDLIKLLCAGNMLLLDYIDGITRCDRPLQDVLNHVLKCHELPAVLKERSPRIDQEKNAFSITRLKKKGTFAANSIWKRIRPSTTLQRGDPVICNVNKKRVVKQEDDEMITDLDALNVYNGNTYRIHDIDDQHIFLEGILNLEGTSIKLTRKFFEGKTNGTPHFEQFCAQTVYRTQGMTLPPETTPIIHIQNTSNYTLEEIYTALSRAKKLDQIYIQWTDVVFQPTKYSFKSVKADTKSTTHVKTGRIYQLVDPFVSGEFKIIYVGQTERTIEEEFEDIKAGCAGESSRPIVAYLREYARKHILHMVEVELVEEFKFQKKRQLLDREAYWIRRREAEGHPIKNVQNVLKEEELVPWTTPVVDPVQSMNSARLFNAYLNECGWKVTMKGTARHGIQLRATNCKRGLDLNVKVSPGKEMESVERLAKRIRNSCIDHNITTWPAWANYPCRPPIDLEEIRQRLSESR